MFKRIAVSIIAALIVPINYLFSYGAENTLIYSEHITDERGQNYSVLNDPDEIMVIKSDGKGEILGKWKRDRTNGYTYINIDAMNVFDGELYCVLSSVNSKNFEIERREWVKVDFQEETAETIYEDTFHKIQNAFCTTLSEVKEKKLIISCLIEGILVTNVDDNIHTLIKPKKNAEINYAAALSDGRILFSDILNRIYIMDNEETLRKIYDTDEAHNCELPEDDNGFRVFKMDDEKDRRQIYKPGRAGEFYKLSVDNNGFCSILDPKTKERRISTDNEYSDDIVFAHSDEAETEHDISHYSIPFGRYFVINCVMGSMLGIIVFVLTLLKRVTVRLKIAVIIIFCLGFGGSDMIDTIDELILNETHLNRSIENAYMAAKIVGAEIDTNEFEKIDWSAPQKSEYFSELEKLMEFDGKIEKITDTLDDKKSFLVDKNYCWIYPIVNGEIRSGICDQCPVNLPGEILIYENFIDDYKQVANGTISCAACGRADDRYEWVIAVSPLKNSDGKIIALFETGISKLNYQTTSAINSVVIFVAIIVVEIIIGIFIIVAASIALLPLKRLNKAVEAAGKGDYGITVKVKGRDEIASIAKAFNEMSQQIYIHTQKLSKINEAYLRFLPSGIISTIGKDSVISVERGDYSSISGYILHIRLINFAEQTEELTNDETFELINNISREIMENILGRSGVIESYNQEEYICIFNDADNARNAAIGLIKRLRELYPRLKTTFVIVKDSMLLGVVGHEKRLGTIMLSSGIRLSKKLGKIASMCGANLIVTHDVSFSAPCPQRLLGKINFDKREYTFFDCFEGDEISIYLSKLDGCAQFEEMVGQFYQNNWTKCRRSALTYLEKNKTDTAAIRYLFLCENNIKHSEEKSDIENLIV